MDRNLITWCHPFVEIDDGIVILFCMVIWNGIQTVNHDFIPNIVRGGDLRLIVCIITMFFSPTSLESIAFCCQAQ